MRLSSGRQVGVRLTAMKRVSLCFMSLMPSARTVRPYRSAASREQMAARLGSPLSRTLCAAMAVFAISMAVKPCSEIKAEHCGSAWGCEQTLLMSLMAAPGTAARQCEIFLMYERLTDRS